MADNTTPIPPGECRSPDCECEPGTCFQRMPATFTPTRWCPECRSAGVVGIEQDVCPTCKGAGKVATGVGEAPEARRERLIANGYKTDTRCTWLAIGKCSQCGRIHDGKPYGVMVDATPLPVARVVSYSEQGAQFNKVAFLLSDLPVGTYLYAAGVGVPAKTALDRFNECEGDKEPDPLERLRFFCSLAMNGQDWLDVEQFFDAVRPRGVKEGHRG